MPQDGQAAHRVVVPGPITPDLFLQIFQLAHRRLHPAPLRFQAPEPDLLVKEQPAHHQGRRRRRHGHRAQLARRIARRPLLPGRRRGQQKLESRAAFGQPFRRQAEGGRDRRIRGRRAAEFVGGITFHGLHFQAGRLQPQFQLIRQLAAQVGRAKYPDAPHGFPQARRQLPQGDADFAGHDIRPEQPLASLDFERAFQRPQRCHPAAGRKLQSHMAFADRQRQHAVRRREAGGLQGRDAQREAQRL